MPKFKLDSSILIDLSLVWVLVGVTMDPSIEASISVICVSTLKALSMYLPKQDSLSDKKALELEEKVASLKKEITATRMRIGLER